MPSPASAAPTAVLGSRSVRVGIGVLAAIGFALSYDALRQMAVAVHIRGVLTYLFPLVIDGFIAVGVIALLLLRTAPTRSRAYVWMLVGAATSTSIWANALHAIRLNQQTRQGDVLRLDDHTVGALSAIAPLALAGAVHLYLVINRHLNANGMVADMPTATPPVQPGPRQRSRQASQKDEEAASSSSSVEADAPAPEAKTAIDATPPAEANPKKGGRRTTVPDEVLWATARAIGAEVGKVRRTPLEDAIRAQGYTIQKDRAEAVAKAVTAEVTSARRSTATAA
ncbi:DUF2637 domain-containing protein [Streptomyces sp. NPDC048416]|uniref:DUF2637 domain-containing protein n=1 Tax=Streptomyces sp. NPDC048416 TaxID=3365546 RepID=UPI0037197AFE